MFFIFNCSRLSGSNNLNLHLEIAFFKKSRGCKNFKILCPSVQIIVALYVTLKQIFFTQFFTMQLWKVNSSPEMFQKIKQISKHNLGGFFLNGKFPIKMISSPNFHILGWCPARPSYFMWRRCLFSLGWPPF